MVYVKLDLGNQRPKIAPCCCVKPELDTGFHNTILPVALLSVHIIKRTAILEILQFPNILLLSFNFYSRRLDYCFTILAILSFKKDQCVHARRDTMCSAQNISKNTRTAHRYSLLPISEYNSYY